MDLTENILFIIACSLVARERTCPQSCSLATAVVLSPVYTAVAWQWVSMSQYGEQMLNFMKLHESNLDMYFIYSCMQCFSWVGTAFPQVFPFVLIFVKVEITPPVHYVTS
jgi:hypothetical protein